MDKKTFKLAKREYFPTLVFQIDLEDPEELNTRIVDAIYSERDRDQEGIARSNFKQLGGWHSHNNLHREEDYKDITNLIGAASERMCDEMGYDPSRKLSVGTMWSIINPPGAFNRAHIHPGCLWSGVYYVQAPENCGQIEFIDPRTMHLMHQARFKPNHKRKREHWTKVHYTPKAGRMIIFPSWLYHGVDPNMSTAKGKDADRIIISFNLNQVKASTKRS